MNLHYTPRAIADLEAIADYLQPRSPQGAVRVRTESSIPSEISFSFRTQAVRKIAVRKYKYLIYYSLDEGAEEIAIITIQHAAKEREFADNQAPSASKGEDHEREEDDV